MNKKQVKKNNAVLKVEKILEEREKADSGKEKSQEHFSNENLNGEFIKAEKENAKARIELAKLKEQNKAEKEREKEEIMREKAKEKKEKRGNGKGLVGAVVSLCVATVVLASALLFTFLMPSAKDTALENAYRKSFYDTVTQTENMGLNLSKIIVTKDSAARQGYLLDLAVSSELAESNLQQLPIEDESKFYTSKLVNQIGDYAKYINKKLASGEEISADEIEDLKKLYEANKELLSALSEMVGGMDENYSFSDMKKDDVVLKGMGELENLSVKFPKLIYDGPFADGEDGEIKGIYGEEISDSKAVEIFLETFSDYNVRNVAFIGNASEKIDCACVSGEGKDGTLYAQISRKGGKIVMFAYAGTCNEVNIPREVALEMADAFLGKLKMENMKAVWVNLAHNVYTINYVYERGGVIFYPDMVKVRVCADTGTVLGLEAVKYYTCHVERLPENALISLLQAREKVSDGIEIDTSRLAVVPIGRSGETLCYEFCGDYNGETFYVYIDAKTGKQVEMFKVVSGTEGELLM